MNQHCCQNMDKHLAEGEVAIYYIPKFREYGVKVLDGGTSFVLIQYCPWCGQKLPESLRDRWFDEIERFGLEPDDSEIPQKYLSDQWWNVVV